MFFSFSTLNKIIVFQRKGALRITCSYRTVTVAAILMIAGILSIGLPALKEELILERKQ